MTGKVAPREQILLVGGAAIGTAFALIAEQTEALEDPLRLARACSGASSRRAVRATTERVATLCGYYLNEALTVLQTNPSPPSSPSPTASAAASHGWTSI